jgi:AcrR family transcriptional regulator
MEIYQPDLRLSIRSRIDWPVANVRTPRRAWIEAALQALGEGGPDAVRVEALASRLGVSKGGFYWHFKDRGALLEEALDAWEKTGTDDIIARIDTESADPRERLRRLFGLAPSAEFTVDLAIREWARRDRDVAKRLRRVDKRRMEFLRSLFAEICVDEDDAAARSMLAFSLLIGTYFIAAPPAGKTKSEALRLALDSLLRPGGGVEDASSLARGG